MITLYGSPLSSASRCIWLLEEIGVPYELKAVDMPNKEHKSPAFLKINPNGKVPAMVDGNVTLFESCAINLYLADAYKKDLLGKSVAERALVNQWSIWVLTELQTPIIDIYIQKFFVPAEHINQKLIDASLAKLPNLFSILDKGLSGKKYLSGNDFTIADVNVGSIATIAPKIGIDLKEYPNLLKWVMTIAERPAHQKYVSLATNTAK